MCYYIENSGITFAMASVNNRDSFVGHYNSSINGESNPTKATRNYECDLQNLRFETAKYATEHKFGDVIAIYNACIQKYPEKEYLYNNRGNMYKLLK